MNYVVITENDISQWKDSTGREYHFPKRYLKYLTKGTVVIYYKGLMKDRSYASKRMTALAHYFGIAQIGEVKRDNDSDKNDYYAEIVNFRPFSSPVLAKQNGAFLESIPTSKIKNYWRDGDSERIINPRTDMVVLCPNCHSMIHRRKNRTLSLNELLLLLKTKTLN